MNQIPMRNIVDDFFIAEKEAEYHWQESRITYFFARPGLKRLLCEAELDKPVLKGLIEGLWQRPASIRGASGLYRVSFPYQTWLIQMGRVRRFRL